MFGVNFKEYKMYKSNTHKINGVRKISLKDYNDRLYIYACICFFFIKVPFDAKKYFFSRRPVPFQKFNCATLPTRLPGRSYKYLNKDEYLFIYLDGLKQCIDVSS